MPLSRALLLFLGVLLQSLADDIFCGCSAHTLSYFYLHLPQPSQGLPQFSIRSYLDDQPIARYDNHTRKMEPLVPWMKEWQKDAFLSLEWVFGADLEQLSNFSHQTGGFRTWQAIWGCELKEDGSKGGFLRYGYNGMDFLSFDKENVRWVAAHPQAQKVKEKWENHPGLSQREKNYLEETCIDWLQRYLSYRKEAPERIKPPVGKVTRKVVDDSLEVLICQAFSFYPKEIQATWTRDGEDYKTLHRNVTPNSDGTYYFWLSIEIDPKERDHFRCRLEHQGLQEPLILAWKEATAPLWWIPVGIAVVMFLVFGIVFWKSQHYLWRVKLLKALRHVAQ